MTAFISHSFENKPEFDNIVDALDQREVLYWNPSEVKAGSSLREQLRLAVERCSVCIFVATRDSVQSSWCGAELGAFWGAGKPVLVYLAEPSLREDELPPIVQGDVWERRIARIAVRAKELSTSAASSPMAASSAPSSIASMTVEQLERLIVGAVSLAAAKNKSDSTSPLLENVENSVRGSAGRLLAGLRATQGAGLGQEEDWHNKILWVDDRPENNEFERQVFEAMDLEFTLALSTQEALQILDTRRFAAIISDMGRKEGPREGYVLLEAIRRNGDGTPFFIYAGSRAVEHRREAAARGAQGTTNMADELVDMVVQSLENPDLLTYAPLEMSG